MSDEESIAYMKLQEQYPNMYVARREREVVASSEDHGELMAEVRRLGIDYSEIIIEFVESPDEIHVY
jgi:hypothetical protein